MRRGNSERSGEHERMLEMRWKDTGNKRQWSEGHGKVKIPRTRQDRIWRKGQDRTQECEDMGG